MKKGLSDKELVNKIRGAKTQIAFAELIGVTQSLVSQYEQGVSTPGGDIWLKMARLVRDRYPLNVYCWQRAGLTSREIEIFLQALQMEGNFLSANRKKSRAGQRVQAFLQNAGMTIESVTEPLGNEPVGGEPASLRGPSKDIQEFCARHGVRPPGEPIAGEPKPPAPAKKAKRERRRKK